MHNAMADEQKIGEMLKDAGMKPEQIKQLLSNCREARWAGVKQRLLSYRSELLSAVHDKQDKLFCLDLLIRKLKLK